MAMFWLMNLTEPSQKTNCAPLGWALKAQSSLIAGTISVDLHPQLIGALVRPLKRTHSSWPVAPIQVGQSSIRVMLARTVPLPSTYDDSPAMSVLLSPSVMSAKRRFPGASDHLCITPSSPQQLPPATL